jgi:hypothetical protein
MAETMTMLSLPTSERTILPDARHKDGLPDPENATRKKKDVPLAPRSGWEMRLIAYRDRDIQLRLSGGRQGYPRRPCIRHSIIMVFVSKLL